MCQSMLNEHNVVLTVEYYGVSAASWDVTGGERCRVAGGEIATV